MNGFLGTRASLMLDVVFLAMFLVVPILGWSISLARSGRYLLHKRVQIALSSVLLVTVALFELDIRLNGWRDRAMLSPYYGQESATSWVMISLGVHLVFAVSTFVLWIVVLARALRNFASPPMPGPHSRQHARWAWIAAVDMLLTAVTGWIFYYLAFVAKVARSDYAST